MTKSTNEPAQPTIFERLAEPFPLDCVEWKVRTVTKDGRKGLALCYIDARSVMARLDEVVGPQNWQDRYTHVNNRTFCELDIRVDDEWITKSDSSGDSDMEAEKGGTSGAFKRAGVKWGIGRYLYDVDALWVECECKRNRDGLVLRNGKPVFDHWTDKGLAELDAALKRAPGPRATGRPFTVDQMLDLIRNAKTIPELRDIHEKHWATVPKEYRKEVLEAKDAKKSELERKEASQREQNEGTR